MENTTKKFKTFHKKIFEFSIFILLAILILLATLNIFSYQNFKNNIAESNLVDSSNCQYFIFTPNLYNQIYNIELKFKKKEIYIFPTFQNIKCIGKIGNLYLEDNIIKGYVYTNTKFFNYLILIFNFGQIFLHYYLNISTKKKFYLFNLIINIFILFNFYNSFNLISFNFLLISHLIIYFLNNEIKID